MRHATELGKDPFQGAKPRLWLVAAALGVLALALSAAVVAFGALLEPQRHSRSRQGPAEPLETTDYRPSMVPTWQISTPAAPIPSVPEIGSSVSLAASSAHEGPPVKRLTAREEREDYEARLERSGRNAEPWHKKAEDTYGSFENVLAKNVDTKIRFSRARCFQAGCEATVTYPDASSLEKAREVLTTSEAFMSYPGAKFQSGPEQNSDGSVSNLWILFPPHETSP